jgi:large subunit ribosomal protein L24
MKIKKGDNVKILSGKDRGKTGVVLKAMPTAEKIMFLKSVQSLASRVRRAK